MGKLLTGTGDRSPCTGAFTPGTNEAIPEPEAKHIITGEETLVVLEYPGELSRQQTEAIREEWATPTGRKPIVLEGGAHLSVLSPKPGDVVLLKVDGLLASEVHVRLAEQLKHILHDRGIEAPVLVADHGYDLSTADEATMRQMGWVRADKVVGTP